MQKMSNSALVSYRRISPNKTINRNHAIDTITIHCMAGNLSVEACGSLFARAAKKASSNYGVGSDGRIALYVEEKDRSWCSSNAENDHRAVTIEVANDSGAPDWHVSDKAMESLVRLIADICKRNQIMELKWKADKKLIGQVDKQNMTVHRWFAAKACPGNYLYEKHGYIAEQVNMLLNGVHTDAGTAYTDITREIMTEREIWNRLKAFGLNDYAVAGVMGNFYAESGLKAENLQNSYNKSLDMTDEQYTIAVDNGSYTNFVYDKAGYGLAQWTYWSRKKALKDFAESSGRSIGDSGMQLDFLCEELSGSGYLSVMKALKGAKTIREASDAMLTGYEKPADQSGAVKKMRASYGETYYNKYANRTEGAETPYQIRVTIPDLYIRKGPGVSYQKTKFTGAGTFTIVEEAAGKIDGKGTIGKWGLLKAYQKNRNGWVCLLYTQKIE